MRRHDHFNREEILSNLGRFPGRVKIRVTVYLPVCSEA
jgi:hypothetical protein